MAAKLVFYGRHHCLLRDRVDGVHFRLRHPQIIVAVFLGAIVVGCKNKHSACEVASPANHVGTGKMLPRSTPFVINLHAIGTDSFPGHNHRGTWCCVDYATQWLRAKAKVAHSRGAPDVQVSCLCIPSILFCAVPKNIKKFSGAKNLPTTKRKNLKP